MIFCHPQAHVFHRKNIKIASDVTESSTIEGAVGGSDVTAVNVNGISTSNSSTSTSTTSTVVSTSTGGHSTISAEMCLNAIHSTTRIESSGSSSSSGSGSQGPLGIVDSNSNSSSSSRVKKGASQLHETQTQKTSPIFTSSFFIGLSFCNLNFKSADVTPSVRDFIYRVNLYDRKKDTMTIEVAVSHSNILFIAFIVLLSLFELKVFYLDGEYLSIFHLSTFDLDSFLPQYIHI